MSITHARVTKPFATWDGRDIHRLDLIRLYYLQVSQEVQGDLVCNVPNGRSGLSVATVDAKLSEKRMAMSPADWKSKGNQMFTNVR